MKRSRVAMAVSAAAIGTAVALAGCSSGSSSGQGADAKQTINVWGWSGAPGAAVMQKVITAFEKANPNITVKYNEIVNTDYENKATLALSSGQPIDVVGVFPNAWTKQIEKYLVPVSDWPDSKGLLDKFQPQTITQEKKLVDDNVIREVPLDSNGAAVGYYNVDILKKAGFSSPPTTWEELKQLSAALKTKEPGVATAIVPADSWFQDDLVMTLAGQYDPKFWNNVLYNKGKWDTPALTQALTQYQQLYTDGTLDKSTSDLKYADAMSAFDQGKAAIVFSGTWDAGLLLQSYRESNKVSASDVGVMPVPAESADKRSMRSFLDTTYGIPTKSTHKAAAAKFVQFLTAGDGVDAWSSSLVGVPAVKNWTLPDDVLSTDTEKQDYAEMQKLIANPSSDRNDIDAFKNQEGSYFLQVAQGSLSPKQAASKGQADWTSGKYN